jgi:hypothetical protein
MNNKRKMKKKRKEKKNSMENSMAGFWFLFGMMGIKFGALHMLGIYSTTEPHS